MSLINIKDPEEKHSVSEKNVSIGIDFGTTHSLVSLWIKDKIYFATEAYIPLLEDDQRVQNAISFLAEKKEEQEDALQDLLDKENESEKRVVNRLRNNSSTYATPLIPSCIAINKIGVCAVGDSAYKMIGNKDVVVVRSVKRLIVLSSDDKLQDKDCFFGDLDLTRCEKTNLICVNAFGKQYTCLTLAVALLKHLLSVARMSFRAFDVDISSAVLTVPAYFNDRARYIISLAAEIADLKIRRILNEPTAAAIYNRLEEKEGEFAVYDFGGGTFDVSVIRHKDGVWQTLSTEGNSLLGGDDVDDIIMSIMKEENENLFNSLTIVQQKKLAILAKHLLSKHMEQKSIEVPINLINVSAGKVKNNTQVNDILHEKDSLSGVINSNKIESFHILRSLYEERVLHLISHTIDLLKSAIKNAKLQDLKLLGIVLAGGSSRIPMVATEIQKHFSIPLFTNVNPDVIVAGGAAIQAAVLDNRKKGGILVDITPLSIGIETFGGLMEKVIERNTPIPCSGKMSVTTFANNQTGVIFNILQGERDLAKDCYSIGTLILDKLPQMKAGVPQIEVEFSIDSDGLLKVLVHEKTSGIKQLVEINPLYNIDISEVKKHILSSIVRGEADLLDRDAVSTFVKATTTTLHARNILSQSIGVPEHELSKLLKIINEIDEMVKNKLPPFGIKEMCTRLEQEMESVLDRHALQSFSKFLNLHNTEKDDA